MKTLIYIFTLIVSSCYSQQEQVKTFFSAKPKTIQKFEKLIEPKDTISVNNDFAFLIGKWKHIASISSNGATKYTTKIKDGQTIIFEINGNVIIEKDDTKVNGTYKSQLRDTNIRNEFKLCISSSKGSSYYIFYFGGNNSTVSLIPVTSEYEIICDEGCSDIYEKIE